jgi:uncharacterized protein with HEPN domain
MQQRDTRDLLEDICAACDVITGWTAAHTREDFVSDAFARAAIERHFEIIGEALKRIIKQEPDLSPRFGRARQIIEFRNTIVHGYFLVDHDQTWMTVTRDVPALRAESALILNQRPPLTP